MKYSYDISENNNLVSISQQDLYSFEENKKILDQIINDPRFNKSFDFLIDIRGIKHTPIVREMRELAAFIISRKEHLKGRAAIISDNEVHHYFAKLAMTIVTGTTGNKSRVFCNTEEALDWLNK